MANGYFVKTVTIRTLPLPKNFSRCYLDVTGLGATHLDEFPEYGASA